MRDRRWLALPVVLTAIFMAILDVFVVNVAAPSLQSDLGTTPEQVQWVVAGYVLAYAVSLVTGGRLGDIYGRRRMFRIGVAGFTAASALCGAAPTPGALIAARVVQGLAAALMAPQVLSVIQVEFTATERRRCLAIMGAVQGAASICGQIIGGGLLSLDVLGLGWRAVFLVNVPVGLTALAAGGLIPESRADRARRLDVGGAGLLTLALLAVVAPVVEGRSAGWPWWLLAVLVAAAALGALWVAHERRVDEPVVDLSLLRLRTFRLGLALALVFFAAVPAFFLVLGLYLQDGHGLTAMHSAVAFTPLAIAFVTASLTAPRLFARAGDLLLAAGCAIAAVGAGAIIAAVGSTGAVAALLPGMVLLGAGAGVVMPGIIHATLRRVPGDSAGSAAGVLATAQQVGNAFGVAGAGTLYFAALSGGFAVAFEVATAWTLAGAGIGALLALLLAAPAGRVQAATSAAS